MLITLAIGDLQGDNTLNIFVLYLSKIFKALQNSLHKKTNIKKTIRLDCGILVSPEQEEAKQKADSLILFAFIIFNIKC